MKTSTYELRFWLRFDLFLEEKRPNQANLSLPLAEAIEVVDRLVN